MSDAKSIESISILTPEHKLINRLDDDFTYLLEFTINPIKKLTQRKQDLVKQWIMKLSTLADHQNIATKLIRNDYIAKLLSCIQNDEFSKPPFNQLPPSGNLKKIDFDFEKVAQEIPTWVKTLKNREEKNIKIGGRDFETYFASKLLENGACAYLAVSTQNEGDRSAWMKIESNKQIDQDRVQKLYKQEFRNAKFSNLIQ